MMFLLYLIISYSFLVPIVIPKSPDFLIRNAESELHKKIGNGNEIGNNLGAQVGTRNGNPLPTVIWVGNGTESEFRVDPCCVVLRKLYKML